MAKGRSQRKQQDIHGLLVVDKPVGMISKDVSRWLEKRAGRLKLGHVGTLDPNASGVLPLLFGRATRLQDYLLDLPKSYEFEVLFGVETDTLDLEGQELRRLPADHVTLEALVEAAKKFVGDIEQVPPIFSAVKYKGKPLYEYARAGQADEVPLGELKRKVRIERFEVLGLEDGRGRFVVTCSRGTYVRVLVKDLAESLGTCGTLARLVRTEAAGVRLDQALSLEVIEKALASGTPLAELLVPIEKIDMAMPRWVSPSEAVVAKLRAGQQVLIDAARYFEGMADDPAPSLPNAWSRPLMLLKEDGSAFGMGAARMHGSGRVQINMKRGLL